MEQAWEFVGGSADDVIALEAEAGTITGSAEISTDWAGYSGAGFVNFIDPAGESVTWTFDVAQTGRYAIGYRYALSAAPRNVDGRPLSLSVNGVEAEVLPFGATGERFSDWSTLWSEVVLPAGTVTLSLETLGLSGANLDKLLIETAPIEVLNTAPTISGTLPTLSISAGGDGATATLTGVTLADPDVADNPRAVCTLADGSALPDYLRFNAATLTLTAAADAPERAYALLLRADDGKAESSAAIAFTVRVTSDQGGDFYDLDGDGIRNSKDADDDDDGLSDEIDPFFADAGNGRTVRIDAGSRFALDFSSVPNGAPIGWSFGLTGLFGDGELSPEARGLDSGAFSFTNGVLHIDKAPHASSSSKKLPFGPQFGVDPNARHLTVSVLIDNPYDNRDARSGEAFGLVIGTGDQDDFLQLTLRGDAGGAFLSVDGARGGNAWPGVDAIYDADREALGFAAAGDTLRLSFDIDTVTGILRPSWSVQTATGVVAAGGETIVLTGALLDAVRGGHSVAGSPSGLAIGVTAVSGMGPPLDLDVLGFTVDGSGPGGDIALTALDSRMFPDRLVFNWIDDPSQNIYPDRAYKESGTVRLANTGESTLRISDLVLNGPFKFLDRSDLGITELAAGASVDIEIGFDRAAYTPPPRGTGSGFDGTLRVMSDDANTPTATVDLAGWWQVVPEAGREPELNDMFRIFGFGNQANMNVLLDDGSWTKSAPEEVLAPYWKIAPGYTDVSFVQIAGFHDVGIATLFIHAPHDQGDVRSLLQQDDLYNQSFFPVLSDRSSRTKTFDAARIPDEWDGDDWFGFRLSGNSSDPTLNRDPAGNGDIRGHFVRFFAATEADGTPIADTYIVAVDLNGTNLDFNDNVYVVSGITPVAELLLG